MIITVGMTNFIKRVLFLGAAVNIRAHYYLILIIYYVGFQEDQRPGPTAVGKGGPSYGKYNQQLLRNDE